MATVTFGLLGYTSIDTAESTTGWSTFDVLDTDIKKEGSNAITGTFRADGTSGYFDAGSAPATAVGKHVRIWINTTNVPYMQPESLGGYEFYMYDGSTTEYVVAFGSDTYAGGWKNFIIDCDLFTTLTLANVQRWGMRVNHHTNAKNVDNMWVDYVRYLDGYYITGGTNGDEVTPALIAARDVDDGAGTLRGYGVTTDVDGVYFCSGKLTIGNSTTTTYFLMDADVWVFVDGPVATGFYEIAADGTVADIVISDSVIRSASATTNIRYAFDMSNTSVSVEITGTVFLYASTIEFASGQTVLGNTFNNCGQITHGGADTSGSTVKNFEGTADTAGLVYDLNADPNGEMDDMVFTKGTAATHAIEFGPTVPDSLTLTGCDFSGYNAADAQTDSALLVTRTSGTVTINLVNCTGTVKYKCVTGASVVIQQSVTLTVTVKDTDGIAIVGAQTAIYKASDDTELMNEDTIAGGIASQTIAYPGSDFDVYIRVRKSSTGTTRYVNASAGGLVTSTGMNVNITLREESVS